MAKKGSKIKELAIELGVTTRQIIDRCRAEGLNVQNSVTRITPADVARVRAWFGSEQSIAEEQEAPDTGINEGPDK